MKGRILYQYGIILIPIIFLIYSAPGALDYLFHFPDEKYYTDAALQMVDKHDYFTPYKGDGSPRFLKPIATYWILIASYKLFGVSIISSRLFFWLAGAFLVLIVYLMTRSITKKTETAVIASLICASNPLVLMSASRSIPDILLTLFLTISAWGFLEIMLRDRPQKKYYWMAYMGAAFAFETKGLPAAAFAGISMLYLLLNPWNRVRISKLLRLWPILFSLAVASFWFILMFSIHGSSYLDSFLADQVGDRVSSALSLAIKNGGLGLINLFAFLLPWILLIKGSELFSRKHFNALKKEEKALQGFILIWVILILLLSGAVFKFYDRYLLPVIPLVSLAFAIYLPREETKGTILTSKIFLGLNILIATLSLGIAFVIPDTILISGLLLGTGMILLWALGKLNAYPPVIRIANGILLLYFNVNLLLYPLLMPNPGKQLVRHIEQMNYKAIPEIYVYGNIRTASNIRIHSNASWDVIGMDTTFVLPATPEHILVINEKEKHLLPLSGYEIKSGSEEWLRIHPEDFPAFLRNPLQKLKTSGTQYLLAIPKKE